MAMRVGGRRGAVFERRLCWGWDEVVTRSCVSVLCVRAACRGRGFCVWVPFGYVGGVVVGKEFGGVGGGLREGLGRWPDYAGGRRGAIAGLRGEGGLGKVGGGAWERWGGE
ncbi:hypothetical protein Tco_0212943 [Tanacetum coccineum]